MSKKVILNAAAPDFELEDFNGKSFRLNENRGAKNIVLVFNRSFL